MTILIVISVAALAWWNGANDNFKGVATLYGSGSASYRVALSWATVAQIAGSLLATLLAGGLIKTFSAKGIVPDAVAADPAFLGAIAMASMSTILLATLAGMPVSTTHALTGALVGAGVVAVGTDINAAALGSTFFLPLLVSPVIAMALTMALYPLAHRARTAFGVTRDSCVCVGTDYVPVSSLTSLTSRASAAGATLPATAAPLPSVTIGTAPACIDRYQGRALGVSAHGALDSLHFVSAGVICFARALNDTPKILALCLSAQALGVSVGLPAIAAAMAAGGVLNSRKVATTMSKKIAPLNLGQGLIANVVTAVLVVFASRAGLPVSTTHVSTSAVFGIGAIHRTAHRSTILKIVGAWLITLPAGAVLGAVSYWLFTR
jgi:inorganic phosphate transporter, PiT family